MTLIKWEIVGFPFLLVPASNLGTVAVLYCTDTVPVLVPATNLGGATYLSPHLWKDRKIPGLCTFGPIPTVANFEMNFAQRKTII